MKKVMLVGAGLGLGLVLLVPARSAFASGPPLANGFTALVVASSGQTISGDIDATGYDLGVYIGPGVHDVTVVGAHVTGANDEGILVQDASDVLIKNSTVEGNGVNAYAGLNEVKGIVLAGTSDVLVRGNTVNSNEHGGIAVLDDGHNSPFAPTAIDTAPVAGTDNVVAGNVLQGDMGDCAIVLAAKNPGGGLSGNVITRNTVSGGVGGIIVAGGGSGPVHVTDSVVSFNVVTGGFIGGIMMHAFGPGVISGTQLIGNVLSGNGNGDVSGATTGIELFAVPNVGTITGTQVLHDSIDNAHFGLFHIGDTGTHVVKLATTDVAVPIAP